MEGDNRGAQRQVGCLEHGLFIAAAIWVLLITYGVQFMAWLVGQLLLIQDQPLLPFAWVLITWTNGLLLLPVVGLLATFTRAPRYKAAYVTWTLATGSLFCLALIRFLPETQTQLGALAQILAGLVLAAFFGTISRSRGYRTSVGWPAMSVSFVVVPIVVLPWLAFGALGSPLDAVLDLLAGVSLGLLAGLLLDIYMVGPLIAQSAGVGRDIAFGGLAAAVTLAIISAGFGFGGNQLLLMFTLPPLGFAAMAIASSAYTLEMPYSRALVPIAVLVGLVAAAPLMFFDPDELTLLLGLSDIPRWAGLASGLAFLLALLAGLVLSILTVRGAIRPRPHFIVVVTSLCWATALAVYFLIGQPGFFGDQLFVILKNQPDLSQATKIADRNDRVRYVYETMVAFSEADQSRLRALLSRYGIGYRPYYLVNALEVDAGPIVGAYLSWQPEVDRVLKSPHLRPLPEPNLTGTGHAGAPNAPVWGITSIGADRVWSELGVTGSGIVVGQSDSGVQGSHPALSEGYRGRNGDDNYNWLDPWNHTASPTDIDGHGTFTLGSAVGRGGIGVAPDAEWFACVNLARNLGNPAHYLDCMQFMLAPYPQQGDPFRDGDPALSADVTNNSWGCPPYEGCDPHTLQPAVDAMRSAGIFVATAAGNAGPRCGSVSDPIAIYQESVAVGAVDKRGNVAQFSSRGPVEVDGSGRVKPDVVAPGVDVLSAYPNSSYTVESGTSAASPHVAGVVALMWSAQPKLIGDIETTERILRETARPYEGQREGCFQGNVPNTAFGYGLIDAYAAVKAALELR